MGFFFGAPWFPAQRAGFENFCLCLGKMSETQTLFVKAEAAPIAPDDDVVFAMDCCQVRLELNRQERKLLFWKSLFVVVLSYALVPLILLKSDFPKLAYTLMIVGIHVVVVVIYFFRVRYRDLDHNWRSLAARLLALAFAIALLLLVSESEGMKDLMRLLLLMLALCVVHMLILLLLMVRVRPQKSLATALNTATASDVVIVP
jgi:hypothetical protein